MKDYMNVANKIIFGLASHPELSLLYIMIQYLQENGSQEQKGCIESYETIAALCKKSKRFVLKNLKALEACGAISSKKRLGTTSVLFCTPNKFSKKKLNAYQEKQSQAGGRK